MLLHIGSKQFSSWSMRPWLVLKAAGIEFEEREHAFLDDKTEQARQWRIFSPTAQVPVLEDNELRVWDSLAICQYLGEKFPEIWPSAPDARAWAYSAAAEMHSGFTVLRTQCPFRLTPATPIASDDNLSADLRRIDALWCEGLQRFGGNFLAGGRFTVADAFYAPVALRLFHYGLVGLLGEASREYLQRVLETDAVREWCADTLGN